MTLIYAYVYLILGFPITYKQNVSDLSVCACLHKTVNRFLFNDNENTYPKGRALMHIYRVVPHTKGGNIQNNGNVVKNYTAITV